MPVISAPERLRQEAHEVKDSLRHIIKPSLEGRKEGRRGRGEKGRKGMREEKREGGHLGIIIPKKKRDHIWFSSSSLSKEMSLISRVPGIPEISTPIYFGN